MRAWWRQVLRKYASIRRSGDARTLGAAAGATLAVRVLGLVSQALAVASFGAGAALDAYLIALIVPGLAAVPFSGAVEITYGPLYSRARAANDGAAAAVADELLDRCLRVAVVTTVTLIVLAPVLVWIVSPGAGDSTHTQATSLAWFVFPSAFPSILTAWSATVLIGAGRVQLPVVAQASRPLALIAALVLFPGSITALSVSVLVGSVFELGISALFVSRVQRWRVRVRPPRSVSRPPLLRLTVSTSAAQAVPVVDQAFAASLGPGNLVLLSLASRFYEVAKASIVQPSARLAQTRMSVAAPGGGFDEQARRELRRAARVGVAAAALVAATAPIVLLGVFRTGEFTRDDATRTLGVALVLGVTLVPFSLSTVLPRALMILGRFRIVSGMMFLHLGINVVLDAAFSAWFGLAGIALATGVSVSILAVLEYRALLGAMSSLAGRVSVDPISGPPPPVPQLE